ARSKRFDMGDDARDLGFPRHVDYFIHGSDQPDGLVTFIANVAGIEPSIFTYHLAELNDLRDIGDGTWNGDETTRQSYGALLHPRAHDIAHLFQLFFIGVRIDITHHGTPDRAVRDHLPNIETNAVRQKRFALRCDVMLSTAVRIDEDRSQSLCQQRLRMGKFWRRKSLTCMGMSIDKARRNVKPRCIDALLRFHAIQVADRQDPIPRHGHIGLDPRRTRAIEHEAVL